VLVIFVRMGGGKTDFSMRGAYAAPRLGLGYEDNENGITRGVDQTTDLGDHMVSVLLTTERSSANGWSCILDRIILCNSVSAKPAANIFEPKLMSD
jgi:hypothetical protein